MTERTDQFDERDQLEGIEPSVDEDAGDASADSTDDAAHAAGDARAGQGPDAFGSPEGGKPV